jgi:hypothetical protein
MWIMDRPCGERIKVRGDNYIADCWLLIADWKEDK